jgi:transposase
MQKKSREQIFREKRRFWKAHIEAWQKSGYSQAEYCRHSNLIYHRLIYWKAKFNKERSRSVAFVPIPVPIENQQEVQDAALILKLQNDRFRIEISQAFCSKTLSRLVAVLEST